MIQRLGILDYHGAQASAVLGLRDMLEVASRLNASRRGKASVLEVQILGARPSISRGRAGAPAERGKEGDEGPLGIGCADTRDKLKSGGSKDEEPDAASRPLAPQPEGRPRSGCDGSAKGSLAVSARSDDEPASPLTRLRAIEPFALNAAPGQYLDGLLGSSGGPPPLAGPLSALILPPSLGSDPPCDPSNALSAWLLQVHREGTLLCSVCSGAFLLAETGLLAGRPATTHWALKARFAEQFPEVLLDTDRLIIDDGDLITAGGLMAWVDLGLRLVERFLGPQAMLTTARHFLVDPGGREQRFYSTFAPTLTHGDSAILKAQRWLHANSGGKVDVAQMAEAARLGERTFLRRFLRATGLRPTEYLQHLRIGKARDQLERSDLAVDEIAWRIGYEDAGAFRKVFQRLMGLSPSEYRRRFALNA